MIRQNIIKEILITKQGIPLEQFIDISLYSKKGYYKNSKPLGKFGDFTTSPEISQLFGEIIGLFIYHFWQKKINCKFNFIELGPGNGTMIIDILKITKSFQHFHNYLNLHFIEQNKLLTEKQKKKLIENDYIKINKKWHKDFINIDNKPSIIIANEFFDCFPISQFQKKNDDWYEKFINYDLKEDRFYYKNLIVKNKKKLKKLKNYQDAETVELSSIRESYFNKICKHIKKYNGLIIIIDYGYFNLPNHFTLQTVYNHKKTNLLENIGKQDITSLINFNEFIKIANENKLKIENFSSQKDFLINNGILERKKQILKQCNSIQKRSLETGLDRLINDKEMGLIYKFLILSKK